MTRFFASPAFALLILLLMSAPVPVSANDMGGGGGRGSGGWGGGGWGGGGGDVGPLDIIPQLVPDAAAPFQAPEPGSDKSKPWCRKFDVAAIRANLQGDDKRAYYLWQRYHDCLGQ